MFNKHTAQLKDSHERTEAATALHTKVDALQAAAVSQVTQLGSLEAKIEALQRQQAAEAAAAAAKVAAEHSKQFNAIKATVAGQQAAQSAAH